MGYGSPATHSTPGRATLARDIAAARYPLLRPAPTDTAVTLRPSTLQSLAEDMRVDRRARSFATKLRLKLDGLEEAGLDTPSEGG
jgi:hypothetical protein